MISTRKQQLSSKRHATYNAQW